MSAGKTPFEVWEAAIACHPRFDIEGYASAFADDAVIEIPFCPPGVPARLEGRADILRTLAPLWERARASGRRIIGLDRVVAHVSRDPDVVVVEFDVVGEEASKPIRLSYVHVVRVRGGLIVHLRDYVDSWAIGQRIQAWSPR